MNPFKEGDFVRLRNGKTKMIVVQTLSSSVYANYRPPELDPHSHLHDQCRPYERFILWDDNDPLAQVNKHFPESTEPMSKPTLYQTKEDTPRYGTELAINSEGQRVLEMRGEKGVVEAFDKDQLTKVVPYTFSAKTYKESPTHFTCQKGQVKVGDVLLYQSGNIYTVTAIDTACGSAIGAFKGSKLETTLLDESE
jgi:hypothetical protein